MATISTIRARRRSAGLRHALLRVQREICATDTVHKLKYLRDFNDAFLTYEHPLGPAALAAQLLAADVLLVGDYHALPASQRGAASILGRVAASGRPVVLGVETVFAKDQAILDEWQRGEIDDAELRERIRYDSGWGYDWEPFIALLRTARRLSAPVYGLDCGPREDMRKIGARDRHAAAKICEIRERHPRAALVVLFGESHLAPNHIPLALLQRAPALRQLTVLQNIDALYWRAAGERMAVDAVQVTDGVICLFNASPLEKYESYRLCIERWRQERQREPDLAPTVYNLIDALLEFLNIEKYAATNGTQPRFLVDRYPEVVNAAAEEKLRRYLVRKRADHSEAELVQQQLRERGVSYIARMDALFVSRFAMEHVAEEAARFVHRACRNGAAMLPPETREDRFYARVLEEALAVMGSLVLCPGRPVLREADLYACYAQAPDVIESRTLFGYREYMEMVDIVVLHKDFETHHACYWQVPPQIRQAYEYAGEKRDFVVKHLAMLLAGELHEAYVAGRVTKRFLRASFFRRLDVEGAARRLYFDVVKRIRVPRRRLVA